MLNHLPVIPRLRTLLVGWLLRLVPGPLLLPLLGLLMLNDGGTGGTGDGGGSGDGDGSGDGAGDGGGTNTDSTDSTDSGDGDGDEDGGEGDATKVTMTQAELNKMLDKRLGRAKSKWESEAKTKADRAKMDEAEKAKAEKADADKAATAAAADAAAARVEAVAVRAAVKADIDPDRIDRFLKVADLNVAELVDDDGPNTVAIGKAITKAVKEWPEFVTKRTPGRSGGDLGGGSDSQPKSLEDAVAARLG